MEDKTKIWITEGLRETVRKFAFEADVILLEVESSETISKDWLYKSLRSLRFLVQALEVSCTGDVEPDKWKLLFNREGEVMADLCSGDAIPCFDNAIEYKIELSDSDFSEAITSIMKEVFDDIENSNEVINLHNEVYRHVKSNWSEDGMFEWESLHFRLTPLF